jgi:hypothetical protein
VTFEVLEGVSRVNARTVPPGLPGKKLLPCLGNSPASETQRYYTCSLTPGPKIKQDLEL